MTEDNQTNIIVSIITGLFVVFASLKTTLVGGLIKGFKKIKSKKETSKFLTSLRKMYEIYETVDSIGYETGADRVILFSGHNCGGVPEIYKPYNVSGLYSVGVPREIFESYKELDVDPFYVETLLKASEGKPCHIEVDKMPDCQLKTYYSLEGVVESYIFYIDVVQNNLIYMRVASKQKGRITKNDQTFSALKVNKIKNLLNG